MIIENKAPNLIVTTFSKVIGGVPDLESQQVLVSIEFALAPMGNGSPLLEQAVTVTSDQEGRLEIALCPGKYWIGSADILRNQNSSQHQQC